MGVLKQPATNDLKTPAPSSARWRALVLLSLAELLGMSLWFSAAAVVPALRLEWNLSESSVGWLTIAIQLGFVCGTLLSAFLNLPDVISVRYLFAVSALAGALANAAFGAYAHNAQTGIGLRFLTGMFLAGVYPPGMKIMATWFQRSRGMALGVLVGALTLGKASPYLINALGSTNWRQNIFFISLLAITGGLIVLLFVNDGPHARPQARFDWTQAIAVFRNRGVRLASFGYFGHMWELYAMWVWIPVMIRASFLSSKAAPVTAEVASFLVIGCGAVGCVVAGLVADRVGRTVVTSWAMGISGSCCLLIGFVFGGNPFLLLFVAAIWGATVVADSAQFSACVTELGDPQYVGTALTMQTCLGFLLTSISIELIPYFVRAVGWQYAFTMLAPGPLLGVLAMLRLRSLPEAAKIANGRR
ncbi:MAG TPA: MFS transporter [Pyrinomonadaceae bacterium]|jgi:MFS family permease|nr:MFS transporter [Pyrinomonadaceae bacterium]